EALQCYPSSWSTFEVKLPRDSVTGVRGDDWDRIGHALARYRGRAFMPHELANRLGMHRQPVLAVILVLGREKFVRRKYCVYHGCSDAPVAYRDFEAGFQPVPWQCPEVKRRSPTRPR